MSEWPFVKLPDPDGRSTFHSVQPTEVHVVFGSPSHANAYRRSWRRWVSGDGEEDVEEDGVPVIGTVYDAKERVHEDAQLLAFSMEDDVPTTLWRTASGIKTLATPQHAIAVRGKNVVSMEEYLLRKRKDAGEGARRFVVVLPSEPEACKSLFQ